MLTVPEAQAKIRERVVPSSPEAWPLVPELAGLQLAEDIACDLDMPPFDKALMDGFAVRSVDLIDGPCELEIIEEVSAGQLPKLKLTGGQATRIMTGAPLPVGADAVVMIERCRILAADRVRVEGTPAQPEQNVLRRGREMQRGDIVLRQGTRLAPQNIGLLAAVGVTSVQIRPPAKVSVLSTGDEVVAPSEVPGPGQIRNSNAPMLLAQIARAGARPCYRGIARDRLESLRPLLDAGLAADVLVLSGGVSAGKFDLVPGVLTELGVEAVFHKVAMKPGKPVFFGLKATGTRPVYVFGLPGNPVSAMVCFELFVRPAIEGVMGFPPQPHLVRAVLVADFAYKTDRPTYYPAQLNTVEGCLRVQPKPWFGSADLRGVATANAFVLFPPGDHVHRGGGVFDVLQLE